MCRQTKINITFSGTLLYENEIAKGGKCFSIIFPPPIEVNLCASVCRFTHTDQQKPSLNYLGLSRLYLHDYSHKNEFSIEFFRIFLYTIDTFDHFGVRVFPSSEWFIGDHKFFHWNCPQFRCSAVWRGFYSFIELCDGVLAMVKLRHSFPELALIFHWAFHLTNLKREYVSVIDSVTMLNVFIVKTKLTWLTGWSNCWRKVKKKIESEFKGNNLCGRDHLPFVIIWLGSNDNSPSFSARQAYSVLTRL